MSSFTARYRSTCADCEDTISPGDEVVYNSSNEVVHVKCPTSLTDQLNNICPRCFMAMARNGTCGCDS